MNLTDLQTRLYLSDYRNLLLAITLLPLQVTIWHSDISWLAQLLSGVHIICFILWHPFWLGEARLRTQSSIAIGLFGLVLTISNSNLLMSFWLMIVASLIAGEPFRQRRDVGAQTLAIIYLLMTLFMGSLPHAFSQNVSPLISQVVGYICLTMLVVLACIPQRRKHQNIRQADVLLSLIFSQAVVAAALGSVIYALYAQVDYLEALMVVLFSLSGILLAFNLMWKYLTGTSALSFLWNRYLLILGSPFESLLVKFSALAKTSSSPGQYLETSFGEVAKLDWVEGISWQAASGRGDVGQNSPYELQIVIADLTVSIYGTQEIRDALAVHARLLAHLICHFYHSIKRERSQAHRAHVQALYETGARLTHDIKNLLQGLKTLSAAGEHTTDAVAFHALFKRQIPTINERLETTLRKLTEPSQGKQDRDGMLSDWWLQLKQRYQGREVNLNARIDINRQIPVEMFNTISENLLDNARAKRLNEKEIDIEVSLISNKDGLILSVIDTGSPVPAEKAQFLLDEPVKSEQGLGVGLYQSAALAKQHDFQLTLNENMDGLVSFSLTQKMPGR